MMNNSFQPNWASNPGVTIADVLNERQISLASFAQDMGSNTDYITALLNGYISINQEVATKLETALGTSAQFWLNRELKYRESVQRLQNTEGAKWIAALPIGDMIKYGWINRTNDVIKTCLDFFAVPDVWAWKKIYKSVLSSTTFRKSETLHSSIFSIATWLRQGEIKSSALNCKPWNKDKLHDTLPILRGLLKKKTPIQFFPELQRLCSDCGIALVMVQTPKSCAASGAAKFISDNKAMIIVSFRYSTEDQFWFTFFHEIAHLLLHNNTSTFIDEETNGNSVPQIEKEANEFSAKVLISEEFQTRMKDMSLNDKELKSLSRDADVPLGIIVGQLQHLGRIPFKNLNGYKRRYSLEDIAKII